ncbi:hypothetical protein SAMN05421753_12234 [Planctomicrobium piriforme]|uniref:Uncharacterized protein n=1 Tax=Planctomicrobium piriforme TaxID=1576369 RepID=A0A1I3RYD6_9PLAN|nr:hypothetical protein SAMN05421753_12234 [Planctomicrobium piriforme]
MNEQRSPEPAAPDWRHEILAALLLGVPLGYLFGRLLITWLLRAA